jgi:isopenicillin N synthase-like dioxygenase
VTYSIPVIDLEAATRADARRDLLDAVTAATEEIGIVQVVNHGVPQDLINDFNQRIGRLLSLPRVRKADLASPTGHQGARAVWTSCTRCGASPASAGSARRGRRIVPASRATWPAAG